MTKWKELAGIAGLTTVCAVGEAAWMVFLVSTTSKIPYVGIPIATVLGVTGVVGALWFANVGKFALKDWYKQYYAIN